MTGCIRKHGTWVRSERPSFTLTEIKILRNALSILILLRPKLSSSYQEPQLRRFLCRVKKNSLSSFPRAQGSTEILSTSRSKLKMRWRDAHSGQSWSPQSTMTETVWWCLLWPVEKRQCLTDCIRSKLSIRRRWDSLRLSIGAHRVRNALSNLGFTLELLREKEASIKGCITIRSSGSERRQRWWVKRLRSKKKSTHFSLRG